MLLRDQLFQDFMGLIKPHASLLQAHLRSFWWAAIEQPPLRGYCLNLVLHLAWFPPCDVWRIPLVWPSWRVRSGKHLNGVHKESQQTKIIWEEMVTVLKLVFSVTRRHCCIVSPRSAASQRQRERRTSLLRTRNANICSSPRDPSACPGRCRCPSSVCIVSFWLNARTWQSLFAWERIDLGRCVVATKNLCQMWKVIFFLRFIGHKAKLSDCNHCTVSVILSLHETPPPPLHCPLSPTTHLTPQGLGEPNAANASRPQARKQSSLIESWRFHHWGSLWKNPPPHTHRPHSPQTTTLLVWPRNQLYWHLLPPATGLCADSALPLARPCADWACLP